MKIIAEVGSNIKNFDDVVISCNKAKEAGSDVVKFQCFSEYDLYGEGSKDYKVFQLDWFENIKKECDKIGIEFMCTGFSPEVYDIINHYVDTHKIASAEITDMHILERVNTFCKPVYLSAGGASIKKITDALIKLLDCEVTIFYCEPTYPAKEIYLGTIKELNNIFGPQVKIGYSDHSIDIFYIPHFAKTIGANVIEKHVNFLDYKDTPDAGHALNYVEFKLMCDHLKGKGIIPNQLEFKHQRILSNGKYIRPR